MTDTKSVIIDALREVYDPEIPINVYDLGLIYDITVNGEDAHVLMSFTSPTCPTADYLEGQVRQAVESVEGIKSVHVEITFEPAWTPERVSKEAKEELGLTDTPEKSLAVSQVFKPDNEDKIKVLETRLEALEKKIIELESKVKQ